MRVYRRVACLYSVALDVLGHSICITEDIMPWSSYQLAVRLFDWIYLSASLSAAKITVP